MTKHRKIQLFSCICLILMNNYFIKCSINGIVSILYFILSSVYLGLRLRSTSRRVHYVQVQWSIELDVWIL
jgi:hypothetical protein